VRRPERCPPKSDKPPSDEQSQRDPRGSTALHAEVNISSTGPRRPADALPFEEGFFDCLFSANVFEHIPPDRRLASLGEMRRVLRPGGVLQHPA